IVKEWSEQQGRGLILQAASATIELVDRSQAAYIDEIEAGERTSGPARLALEVPDIGAAADALREQGAKALGSPVETPWGDLNQRLQTSEGLQITLYRSPVSNTESEMA
ncbi:MAG TPA: VOC family protein, partial [Rubrobacteraceae bacterium]|nr:VOC family protein [Rubrobacteraceae bacterium]